MKMTSAINRPEAITNQLQGIYDVLTLAGWFIGLFLNPGWGLWHRQHHVCDRQGAHRE
jgi:hypothetical protein